MNQICRWIYHVYWEPLLDLLTEKGIERVVVIPDGWMTLLPLHLGYHKTGVHCQYVCDQFEISFCPSLTLLLWARQREGPAHEPILCFGNPTTKCPIPLVADEIDAIQSLWPKVHRLLGEDCTQTNILRLAERLRPGIVHAATHGKVAFEDPLGSGLLIHLEPEKSEDPLACYLNDKLQFCWIDEAIGNVLTLDTIIQQMKLENCHLAVLSACEMGVNQITVPRENLSLASGFLAAGVPSVVAPLWPVADAATKLLMERFYFLLKQKPLQKGAALLEAQRWLRDLPLQEAQSAVPKEDLQSAAAISGSEFPFCHVFFWGSFQLIGSPR